MKSPDPTRLRRQTWLAILAAIACAPTVAEPALRADPAGPPPQDLRPRPAWQGPAQPLPPERLDRVRGGFQGPEGLVLSFGIERLVYMNGTLVTTTRIGVQGMGTSGAALQHPGLSALPDLGTVVQNSLSDQRIQTLTIVNASANSLELLRSWSLQLSIRDAVTGSLRR